MSPSSSSSSTPSPSSTPTRAPTEEGQSCLLALPRELRDQIYREYILTDTEGYTYDFEAGKLRTADGSPIDLNLMYTCRLVAAEMAGLALKLQTITFSTIYSEDLRFRALYWAGILCRGLYDETDLEFCAPQMPDEMADEVAQRYRSTYFYDIFDRLRTGDLDVYGHAVQSEAPEQPPGRARRPLQQNLLLTCADYFYQQRDATPLTAMRHDVQRHRAQLEADNVTRRIAEYMAEASVPEMPAPITLVFDGAPLPELSSRTFQETVQRDAAWQTAFDRAFHHPARLAWAREALHGVAWDEARISAEIEEQNRQRGVNTPDEWVEAWSSTRPTTEYQTEPPLPEYHLLFDELVIPLPQALPG
ncbi:hypothetical protein GE09DRAFT_1291459 [Coniochaeta sp. 2T2.1]|nr:hypothetical protein GE09DRAFT_1291459 [Coniochaeta sp. 2T2.1]